jgi:twinkle protein
VKTFADYDITLKPGASGETKTTCPQCSPSRKKKNYPCLNVSVDKGCWNCWHCGWTGGLARGVEHRPEFTKTFRKPDYVAKSQAPDAVAEWFTSRGITPEVMRRNQIGAGKAYFPQVEEERGCVMFPYLRGSEVVNVKYRTRDKLFRMESGCERILYGLNDVEEKTIWVEGEIDKLSLEVAGFKNCVSVPDGAPAVTAKNYEAKFEFLGARELEAVRTHIIAVDSDEPGRKLRDELVRRLGPEACLLVIWPDGCKDANDVLMQLGVDALCDSIKDAQPLPIEGAHGVEDYAEDLRVLYERGSPRGSRTGWDPIDDLYTVRANEMTVLTGIPNAGKSEWLDALLINLAEAQGWIFAVFSPENWPVPEHIKKLAEKRIGKPFEPGYNERMSVAEWDMAQSWLARHFVFIEPAEPTLDAVLHIAKQLVLRKGVRGVVIDPYNEIEHSRPEAMSETEYISQCLSKIRRFSRNHGVHVWIVAHPTKLHKDKDGTYPVPTPYDISGSANWRNKADNCITVWRDLDPKKRAAEVEIHVQKIRHKIVGKLGMATLNYDRVTGRYHVQPKPVDGKSRAAGE